jgi:hypothetical protein
MLLIGFTWIFVALFVAFIVKYCIPGPWDQAGPISVMVAGTGAFFGSVLSYTIYTPPGTDPSSPAIVPGIVFSIVGGLLAFGMYAGYARKQLKA